MSMWRIGILSGTGTAWKRTIPALAGSDLCRVSVVHGRDPGRLAAIAEAHPEIRVTTSESEFAGRRDEYDVVFVASPPFLHLSHVELAVGLGAPIICEKPLVTRRADLDAMVELLRDGPPFMLAHQVRHQPAVADLAAIVQGGQYGPVVAADLQWCFLMNPSAANAAWKQDPERGGANAMFDAGVHAVDLALRLFGVPERVAATGHRTRVFPGYDTVLSTLDYDGFAVTVLASQSGSPAGNGVRITMTDAAVRAPGLLGEESAHAIEITAGSTTTTTRYPPVNLYRAEVENFCRGLAGGEPVGSTADDAIAAARILFAVEDAIEHGTTVTLGREQPSHGQS